MTAALRFMLRSTIISLRRARRYLRLGLVADAVLTYGLARHDLGYAIGMQTGSRSVERVRRAAAAVGEEIDRTVRQLTWGQARADKAALICDVAAGIEVLQTRDGIEEVTHEMCVERARNIVAGLVENYRVLELQTGPRVTDIGQVGQIPQDTKRDCGSLVTGGPR
jgi:hypothetical protein